MLHLFWSPFLRVEHFLRLQKVFSQAHMHGSSHAIKRPILLVVALVRWGARVVTGRDFRVVVVLVVDGVVDETTLRRVDAGLGRLAGVEALVTELVRSEVVFFVVLRLFCLFRFVSPGLRLAGVGFPWGPLLGRLRVAASPFAYDIPGRPWNQGH
ncbi:hypothetical protein MTO96_035514 [Rhipicephalus appendiculatus]